MRICEILNCGSSVIFTSNINELNKYSKCEKMMGVALFVFCSLLTVGGYFVHQYRKHKNFQKIGKDKLEEVSSAKKTDQVFKNTPNLKPAETSKANVVENTKQSIADTTNAQPLNSVLDSTAIQQQPPQVVVENSSISPKSSVVLNIKNQKFRFNSNSFTQKDLNVGQKVRFTATKFEEVKTYFNLQDPNEEYEILSVAEKKLVIPSKDLSNSRVATQSTEGLNSVSPVQPVQQPLSQKVISVIVVKIDDERQVSFTNRSFIQKSFSIGSRVQLTSEAFGKVKDRFNLRDPNAAFEIVKLDVHYITENNDKSAVKEKPNARNPSLEALVEKETKGFLDQMFKSNAEARINSILNRQQITQTQPQKNLQYNTFTIVTLPNGVKASFTADSFIETQIDVGQSVQLKRENFDSVKNTLGLTNPEEKLMVEWISDKPVETGIREKTFSDRFDEREKGRLDFVSYNTGDGFLLPLQLTTAEPNFLSSQNFEETANARKETLAIAAPQANFNTTNQDVKKLFIRMFDGSIRFFHQNKFVESDFKIGGFVKFQKDILNPDFSDKQYEVVDIKSFNQTPDNLKVKLPNGIKFNLNSDFSQMRQITIGQKIMINPFYYSRLKSFLKTIYPNTQECDELEVTNIERAIPE